MNGLDVFESLRPEHESLDAATAARVWERITTPDSPLDEHSRVTPGPQVPDRPVDDIVEVGGRHDAAAHGRRWLVTAMAAAAATVLVVVGLASVQRPAEEPPAQQSPLSVPTATPLPSSLAKPDRFAVVTDAWDFASTATASWGGLIGWDNAAGIDAVVARVDGEYLRDPVVLSSRSELTDLALRGSPQVETVAGIDVEVYVEPGSPAITTVVLPTPVPTMLSGANPLAYLEAVGEIPISEARVNASGEITMTVGQLPSGYTTVVPPTELPLGSVEASTRADDAAGGEGIGAYVTRSNPMIALAQVGDLQRVDVNGTEAWLRDRGGPGSTVVWQVSETTWAQVGGASSADDALAFARSLEFVDEATWVDHYIVDEPNYPTRDEMLTQHNMPGSTAAGGATPRPVGLVGARSEAPTAPTDTPVACGDTPPLDIAPVEVAPAATPDAALVEVFNSVHGETLFRSDYTQIHVLDSGTYRYEARNDQGWLVTVVDISPTGEDWQATRLQVSPC